MKKLIAATLVSSIALCLSTASLALENAGPSPNTASDSLCPNFHATSSGALPLKIVDQLAAALTACTPDMLTNKPITLCMRLATNGSISEASLSSDSLQESKSDPDFAAAAQQKSIDIRKNCGPFSFLPIKYYDLWKEVALTIQPK